MGPPSPSFAAEAHLLLHGPGPARIQPNTRLRRELCAQLASSPRFVTVCQDPLCMPDLTGESPYKRLRGPPPLPARWAASRPNGWLDRRTLPPLPICPAGGSTRCTCGDRRRSSCSTWIRARARLTASRKAAPTTGTSAAPAITRCSCSTSSAIWSGAPCAPATFTAPTAGGRCWSRWSPGTGAR